MIGGRRGVAPRAELPGESEEAAVFQCSAAEKISRCSARTPLTALPLPLVALVPWCLRCPRCLPIAPGAGDGRREHHRAARPARQAHPRGVHQHQAHHARRHGGEIDKDESVQPAVAAWPQERKVSRPRAAPTPPLASPPPSPPPSPLVLGGGGQVAEQILKSRGGSGGDGGLLRRIGRKAKTLVGF